VVTKSIRLSDAEAREIAGYVELVGGSEAAILKEALLRGLREIRLSRGIAAYVEGGTLDETASIAGLPRAPFLHVLMERGVVVLRGPDAVRSELETLLEAEAAAQGQ
jgi:predicted HTH domain antitoxin